MVKEIRIYVEGGGKGTDRFATIKLREGFRAFFKELDEKAKKKNIRFQPIPSGSTDETYRSFERSVRDFPQSFSLLLVDSDKAVPNGETARSFLQKKHKKWLLQNISDEQCHLMVQIMESWFVADVDALKNYYGQDFNESAIPKNANVEKIDKTRVENSLKNATRQTQKNEYHKIHHGGDLLGKIDAKKVRRAAHFCEILFDVLAKKIG